MLEANFARPAFRPSRRNFLTFENVRSSYVKGSTEYFSRGTTMLVLVHVAVHVLVLSTCSKVIGETSKSL